MFFSYLKTKMFGCFHLAWEWDGSDQVRIVEDWRPYRWGWVFSSLESGEENAEEITNWASAGQ